MTRPRTAEHPPLLGVLGVLGLLGLLAWAGCSDETATTEPGDADAADGSGAVDAEASEVDAVADAESDGDVGPNVECVADADETARPEGLGFWDGCPQTFAELLPRVRVGGQWLGAGEQGPCTATLSSVSCPAGDDGTVTAELGTGARLVVRFEAARAVSVEGLELIGPAAAEGATGWLSSGFQSWSQSGIVALGGGPDAQALENALTARGDGEVIRSGHELSWFYTAVGGGPLGLVAGALSADRFKPWVQVTQGEDGLLRIRLAAGGTGESVPLEAGDAIIGPTWFLGIGQAPEELLEAYGEQLPRARRATPETGWNSWYELWDDVDEAAVRANAPLAADLLGPHLQTNRPLRIVVDDGWQQLWGEWTPNDKFPAGLDGLAADLHGAGYEVGVWLAPFLVDADSALLTDHPEWFVPDLVYNHTLNGPMRVLDVTNPGAAAHLTEDISRIVGWGFDFLKIDFLFTGTWEGERDEDVTGMEAFHRGMALIREAAGDDTVLLAVAAPPVAVFPYVEAWRVGWDIALETFGPSWPFVQSQARSLAVRWPLCRAVLCDADPALLRGLPESEVEVGSWVVALSGGGFFLSDDLRALPEERATWGLDAERLGLGTGGVAGRPERLFPDDPPRRLANAFADQLTGSATHVVPVVWAAPDGTRVAIDFGEEGVTVEGQEVPPRTAVVLGAE